MNPAELLPPGHLDREAQVADELERLLNEQARLAELRERAVNDYQSALELRDNLREALPSIDHRRARLERSKMYPTRQIRRKLRLNGSLHDCIALAKDVLAIDHLLAQLPGIEGELRKELAEVEQRIKVMETAGRAMTPTKGKNTR